MSLKSFRIVSLILLLLGAVAIVFTLQCFQNDLQDAEKLQQSLLIAGGIGIVIWAVLQLMVPKAEERSKPTLTERPKKTVAQEPQIPDYAAAVQLLGIFQKEGRLIDFLHENLGQYEDAQIGAAVRVVHEGCRKALNKHFTLKHILDAREGEVYTVPANFSAMEIRLTGNVVGEPPFNGTVVHRGWRIERVNLPKIMKFDENDMILAAAEVELN